MKEGMLDSAIAEVGFTINEAPEEQVAEPVISPAGGSYIQGQEITIASATPDAKIYYTMDGSTPTQNSTLYSGPFALNQTAAIKAIAMKEGMIDSKVATVEYEIKEKVQKEDKPWIFM